MVRCVWLHYMMQRLVFSMTSATVCVRDVTRQLTFTVCITAVGVRDVARRAAFTIVCGACDITVLRVCILYRELLTLVFGIV